MAMSDDPKTDAETPLERALRLKKAAQAAKPKPPGAGRSQRRQSAGMAAGASKPAMRK
jgi:hypothetical protein